MPTQKKTTYPPETAGRLITTRVPTAFLGTKIGQLENCLRKNTEQWETINYIYILNYHNELKGVISIKEIFRAEPEEVVDQLMAKDMITARAHTDQERVAFLAVKHSLKAVPVVDKQNRFLGVVSSDVILDILNNEAAEDLLRAAGIGPEKFSIQTLTNASPFTLWKKRLPWLVLGIMGGLFAALLIDRFKKSLESDLLLAAFIPTIVYIADSVGSQTQTLFIRTLAVEEDLMFWEYFKKELIVILGLAITLSILVGAAIILVWQAPLIGLVLTIAVTATIIAAGIVGIGMPYLFRQFKLDPAIASGPLATIIRDLTSLFIYFATAQALLAHS